jgi:FkbM family methyltransferase
MTATFFDRAGWAARRLYLQHVRRDPFEREMARWRAADGDRTLRLRYPLEAGSTVWDLGGYRGDFAAEMRSRYGCNVDLFEPLPALLASCVARFGADPAVRCLPYGLGRVDAELEISDAADASSFVRADGHGDHGKKIKTRIRALPAVWRELATERVDLMKINIEGGEYDVLTSLIDSGLIGAVRHLQIQFHTFVPDAAARRDALRTRLLATHVEEWCYPFVWESWRLRT